jgi:hypothetical protein
MDGRVMTRRLIIVSAAELLVLAALLVVALDVAMHHKFEKLGGMNMWGYRGPVMPHRQPNELRIAVAGGSFAFGWGVAAHETFTNFVRQFVAPVVDEPGRPAVVVTAVNLAARGVPASAYADRIRHFRYLQPDVICVVADPPPAVERRAIRGMPQRSRLYAATGYEPILPLVFAEKAEVARGVVVPSLLRSTAAVLDAIDTRDAGAPPADDGDYIGAVLSAAQQARTVANGVVVVAPPFGPPHTTLGAAVAQRFGDDPRVRFVDLAASPEITDPAVWLDPVDLSVAGHERAARPIASAVIDLVHH